METVETWDLQVCSPKPSHLKIQPSHFVSNMSATPCLTGSTIVDTRLPRKKQKTLGESVVVAMNTKLWARFWCKLATHSHT